MKLQTLFSAPIYKNTLRRYWYIGVLNFILCFFAIPVYYMLGLSRTVAQVAQGTPAVAITRFVTDFFTPAAATFMILATMAMGVLCSLVLFSYLHSKKQVSFYHGQPVSRVTLYTTRMATAITLFLGTYLVNVVVALIVCALSGYAANIAIVGVFATAGYLLLVFVLMLAIGALAAMLCGTVLAHAEMILLLLFTPIMMLLTTSMLFGRFFSTFTQLSLEPMLTKLSPVTHLFEMAYNEISLVWVLFYIALTAVLIALGLFTYKKRRSERAETALAFDWVEIPIRAVACFIAATLLGMFMDAIGNFYFMLFGFATGALLCHMFCQIQFKKDFKAMFTGMKAFAIFAACFVAILACIMTDVFGYDRYIPKFESIKTVSIDFNDEDTRPIAGYDYHMDSLQHMEFDDKLVIEQVLNISQFLVDNENFQQTTVIDGVDGGYNAYSQDQSKKTITVSFNTGGMLNTIKLFRFADIVPMIDQMQALVKTEQYKQKHVILQAKEQGFVIKGFTSNQINNNMPDTMLQDPQIVGELTAAIEKDVMEVGASFDKSAVLSLYAQMSKQIPDEKSITGLYEQVYRYVYISVYEDYTNTLAVLEKHGIDFDKTFVFDTELMSSLIIYDVNNQSVPPLEVKDPERILELQGEMVRASSGNLTILDSYVGAVMTNEMVEQQNAMDMGNSVADMVKYTDIGFVYGTTPQWIKDYFAKAS